MPAARHHGVSFVRMDARDASSGKGGGTAPMDPDSLGDMRQRFLADCDELHRRLGIAVAGLSAGELDRIPTPGANSIAVIVTHLLASELDWLGTAAGQSVTRN